MAILPLAIVTVLGIAQVLAAGIGHELAAHAAENGAIALADGEDPRDAVREALPGWAKDRVQIKVDGREVRVSLKPLTVIPGAGEALATDASADAGPGPDAGAAMPAAVSTGPGPGLGAVTEPTVDQPAELGLPGPGPLEFAEPAPVIPPEWRER
ncbi:hypothetical protein DSM112329_01713 [Paraconexibacter sp. AEG42_29]|uniref:TadE-like protein n=1 Tax=Paraconexibacter sp. AEG42_29 TaxID=2997339 RepID=A0AAU7AT44_9ACTN